MDSAEQAEGEKRVRRVLVDPLERRGLAKPASLTKVQFEEMIRDLCQRLAYMSELNLMALEEEAAGNPGGKDCDRFPIANRLLDWARQIQPPGDDASPLLRAVFAAEVGQEALSGGWAPELLSNVRRNRAFPRAYAASRIRADAEDNVRRMRTIERRLANDETVIAADAEWRSRRMAVISKCQRIADLASEKRSAS